MTSRNNLSPDLLRKLSALEKRWGKLDLTSGFRTPEQNRDAGGVAGSLHLTGEAIDVRMPPEKQREFIAVARDVGFTGIGVGEEKGFVHLDVGREREWGYGEGGAIVSSPYKDSGTKPSLMSRMAQWFSSENVGTPQSLLAAMGSDSNALIRDGANKDTLDKLNGLVKKMNIHESYLGLRERNNALLRREGAGV